MRDARNQRITAPKWVRRWRTEGVAGLRSAIVEAGYGVADPVAA
ncbi:hypothetical protein [Streptomyces nigrescens]|uniref:Transposase n=1 Tax=Streptomyces nigrescens TaxID=1920 RepID=A0ABY7ITH7_STRNI|nr:hypothetical protein [Streptomyces nigrescens]WAU02108.1 hypothetical protein STRNI_000065 [Streptomyces nigrescens]